MFSQIFWTSVRHGLKEALGEAFTDEVEETWRTVFMYIISKMRDGTRIYHKDIQDASVTSSCSANYDHSW